MRFRLVENITTDWQNVMSNEKSTSERCAALANIIQTKYSSSNLSDLLLEEDDNAVYMLKVIANLGETGFNKIGSTICKIDYLALDRGSIQNIGTLVNILNNGSLDTRLKIFNNKQSITSLVDRNAVEFEYALKVLSTVYNEKTFKKEFGNTSAILNPDRYLFNGNRLKPSGNLEMNEEDISTLYGTMAMFKRVAAAPRNASIGKSDETNSNRNKQSDKEEKGAKAKKMIPKDPSENGGKKKLTISGNYYWSDRHNCWVLEE